MVSQSWAIEQYRSGFSETDRSCVKLSNGLSLQIYSDSRPHNHKIARIQKGLTVVYNGLEMVGEGTGFGVPIIKCTDETFFSGLANVWGLSGPDYSKIIKIYDMNTVRRKKLREIDLKNRTVRTFCRHFVEGCQKHRHLRSLMLADLSQQIGLRSDFMTADSRGKIFMTYSICKNGCVNVEADFKHIRKRNLQKIFLLNEQGSAFFRKYEDSKGVVLLDRQIGTWEAINAKWAMISALPSGIGFRLWDIEGAILRRGRELLKNKLNWIGLDYEISPDRTEFEYSIEILGVPTKR